MKTFVFSLELGTYDYSITEDEILKDFMKDPNVLIKFIERAFAELEKAGNDMITPGILIGFIEKAYKWIEYYGNDIAKIKLNEFKDKISTPIVNESLEKHLTEVLKFSQDAGNNQSDVNEFISKMIEK